MTYTTKRPMLPGRRRAATLLAAIAFLPAVWTVASPATAAAGPVVAGLTITPSTIAAGGVTRVVATATNTTSATVQASIGIDVPAGLRAGTVSGSACTPRNLGHLVYCGIQRLSPQQTATITITVVPAASGSYPFRSYARITYTTGDTFAYGTLTVT